MTEEHEHPADAAEQEIKSEAPEFAEEQAERTVTEAGAEAEPQDASEAAEQEPAPAPKLERLQKILAQAGIASRRHAEELITEGRVQVNGQVVTVLGSKADPARDHIRVDGKLLHGAERLRYFVLNKPKGYVTTVTDPENRPTVMEFFAKAGERLYPVGRLDYQSEGLLLVTNDGELANQLTRASSGVEKTYLVKVAGQPGEEQLERLRSGVAIDKGRPREGKVHTAPAGIRQIRKGDNPWYEVVLIEGRNRELRKMFEEIGHHVEKIRRVGYGPLVLDVAPGKTRELFSEEVEALRLTAAGKLKPRRPKATRMLPKEAGQSTEERIAKETARRGKKFPGQYRRPDPDRGEDAGWRPRERSAEPRTDLRADPGRTPREDARGTSSKSGGRFGAKPGFGGRPPRAEGKFRSDRPQTGAKPGFNRRPPAGSASGRAAGSGTSSRGSGRFGAKPGFGGRPPRAEGKFRSDRPQAGAKPGFNRRPSRDASFPSERPQGRPARPGSDRPQTGDRSDRGPRPFSGRTSARGFGAGGFGRSAQSRPGLDIRPVEAHDNAFDRERPRAAARTEPRTERKGGRPTGREESSRPFRGGPKKFGAKQFGAGSQRREGSGRPSSGGGKQGSSYRGKPGGKPGGRPGGGAKRSGPRPGGKRNFGRKPM